MENNLFWVDERKRINPSDLLASVLKDREGEEKRRRNRSQMGTSTITKRGSTNQPRIPSKATTKAVRNDSRCISECIARWATDYFPEVLGSCGETLVMTQQAIPEHGMLGPSCHVHLSPLVQDSIPFGQILADRCFDVPSVPRLE